MRKNNLIRLFLAVWIIIGSFGFNPAASLADTGNIDKTFDIVEISDLHGNIGDASNSQVAAVMATNFNEIRRANPNRTLILSAGDNYQGTAISNLQNGKPVMQVFNAMGVAASALGNHEFDWGLQKVTSINGSSIAANYPIVCANLFRKGDASRPVFEPYQIFTLDGVKVAVIGGITETAPSTILAANILDYDVQDNASCINKYARQARAEGAQIVIALIHEGDDSNNGTSGPIVDIAHKLKGVDAVLGGHTHSIAQTTVVNGDGKSIPLGIANYNGKGYIDLKLTLHADGAVSCSNAASAYVAQDTSSTIYPYGYKASYPVVDHTVIKIVADAAAKEAFLLSEELGSARIDLNRGQTDTPFGDSLAGQWVAGIIRATASSQIGFQHNGGLRCDIPKGPVTMATIYQFLPFDNVIITSDMTGSQLKTILEEAVMDDGQGIQVSGLKFTYDPDKPSFSRVVSISLSDGTPVDINDNNKTYQIATNDFLMGGTTTSPKDGFSFASQSSNVVDTHILVRDALANAVRAAGSNGISVRMEKRIQNIGNSVSRPIQILINDQELKTDVAPIIQSDWVLVPIGSICDALGGRVEWNPQDQNINIALDDITLELTIGSNTAIKDGETISLDAAPQIVNSRTLVPLSFISESLGYSVQWESDIGQVVINS